VRRTLALAVLIAGRAAVAHPFFVDSLGGTVFVGPTSAHPTAIFWNPAAVGLLKGTHFFVGGTARLDFTSTERATISTADGAPTPGGDKSFPSSSAVGFSPGGFLGVVTDAGTDRFNFGLALYTPFAERLPAGEGAGAYHEDGGWLYTTDLSLSVTFRFSSSVYAGAAFTFVFPQTQMSFLRDRALDGCAAAPCGLESPANAERYSVATDLLSGVNAGFQLGLLARVADWWFGASVAALTLLPTSTADVIRTGSAQVTPAGETQPLPGESSISFRLPTLVHFGARHRLFPDWDLLVQGRWITYSSTDFFDVRLFGTQLRDAGIPERILRYRGYRDAVAVEAGLENPPEASPRFGVRLRVETSALPTDRVAPGLIDAPSLTLGGGAELRLGPRWALVVGLAASLELPVHVDPSAYSPVAQIACTASGYDLDTCDPVSNGRGISSAAGTYLRLRGDITFGLSYDVW
jgi:long-subunit fatty acid transport protein